MSRRDDVWLKSFISRICDQIEEYYRSPPNYVQRLIQRFVKNNPGVDPESVDWVGYYDPSLEYSEILGRLRRAYPMYRWDDGEMGYDEERYFSELYNHLLCQARDLPEEMRLKLIRELEAEFGLEKPEEPREEAGKVEEVHGEVKMVETAPKPVEKPIIDLKFLARYPMLEEAKKVMSAFTVDNVPEEVYERAFESVIEAIKRGEISTKLDSPLVEILSKPVMVMLAGLMPSEWLKRRVALAEALRVEKLMHVDSEAVFNLMVERLNSIGLKIEKTEEEYRRFGEYKMHFVDYLKMARPLLSEPRWKMVNRVVQGGYVFLNKAEVVRLIRTLYQQIILDKIYGVNPREVSEKVRNFAESVKPRIRQEVMQVRGVVEEVKTVRGLAPCIRMMIAKLKAGDEVSHIENFAVASYLLNIGKSVDEVLELFKNRSDFDERIARYQVEHIAGVKGSRIKYKPPSCEKLRSLGLCYKNGEECPKWIKNPLSYREGGKSETG